MRKNPGYIVLCEAFETIYNPAIGGTIRTLGYFSDGFYTRIKGWGEGVNFRKYQQFRSYLNIYGRANNDV